MYASQRIRFAKASSHNNDFSCRNRQASKGIFKVLSPEYKVSLKKRLQQGILEPEFYGDLVHRFRKYVGKCNFLEHSGSSLTVIKYRYKIHVVCDRLHT